MIGQKKLLGRLDKEISEGKLPHFIIIQGGRGSGKFSVANYISSKLNAELVVVDKSVEAVRNLVSTVEKSSITTVYVFQRAEELSAQAVNAMLKTLEEPTPYAYFVFTTRNDQMLLETIKSRGTMYNMDGYFIKELTEYNNGEPVPEYCKTPYDVYLFNRNSGLEEFVQLVMDNISSVPLVNALKIAERVDVDDTDETKFDLNLFFEVFKYECFQRMNDSHNMETTQLLYDWMTITSRYQRDALRSGANMKMLFDMWILDIQEASVV